MNKLFKAVNNLFESSDDVILTERGHKYIQPTALTGRKRFDPYDEKYTDIHGNTGSSEKSLGVDTNIFTDVIKHLAPKGFYFEIEKDFHRYYRSSVYKVFICKGKNNSKQSMPLIDFEVFYNSKTDLPEYKFKIKRPTKSLLDKELPRELTSKMIEDIEKQLNKLPKGILMKNLTEEESRETIGNLLDEIDYATSIGEIESIGERFKNVLDRSIIQDEIKAIEEEYDNVYEMDEDSEEYISILDELKSCIMSDFSGEEENLNEDIKDAVEILKNVPEYSPQWQGMVDYLSNDGDWDDWVGSKETREKKSKLLKDNKFWKNYIEDYDYCMEKNYRTVKSFEDDLEQYMEQEPKNNIIGLAKAGSPSLEDKVKETLKDRVGKKRSKDEEDLYEAYDSSVPYWVKRFLKWNKSNASSHKDGPMFTDKTKVEVIDIGRDMKKLKKLQQETEKNGGILLINVSGKDGRDNTTYWFKNRRWRDVEKLDWSDEKGYSTEDFGNWKVEDKDYLIKAAVVTNYDKALDDMSKKGFERDEARKGGVFRRDALMSYASDEMRYEDGKTYGDELKFDKSGYQIDPDKYTDMLRELKTKKLVSSNTLDKLEMNDYINRFNELTKKAADYISRNLKITYKAPKYSANDYDSGVSINNDDLMSDLSDLVGDIGYELDELVRRIRYVKAKDDKEKNNWKPSPKDQGYVDVEKWIKDQMKTLDKQFNKVEKILSK